MVRIGIIALQGSVEEHIAAMKKALQERKGGEVVAIKHRGIIPTCDAIVIPGGESTTLSRLAWREGIAEEIIEAAKQGKPILGTCAGLILLAKYGDDEVARSKQKLLGLMDIHVNRNAFGRQRESFEVELEIKGFDEPFHAVFIRAPAIIKAGEGVEVLARYRDFIVAARQGNLLALAFHPELTNDLRLHHYFLSFLKP
ncbi:MAG: pyridoxal 5'-phosphate synthase glutaminase subunit PdxT [Methanocellales archaeon]